jgi:TonB-dependent Receptor Plug Domain.
MTAEDTIKYLPSIQVRKRYIGDTNAPVGWRTSGTGSSARGLIYADGILLSSLLGNNNGNTGSPRWNMVSPSEIERVDVNVWAVFSGLFRKFDGRRDRHHYAYAGEIRGWRRYKIDLAGL